MEIGIPPPLNLTIPTAPNHPKSPETRWSQTPTSRIRPAIPNGLFKHHAPPHLKPRLPSLPTSPAPEPSFHFQECMKNHAAASGRHVLDGCCEFMPSPAAALSCAACGCHRNFHRRAPPPPMSSSYHHPCSAPNLLLALRGGPEAAPFRRSRKRFRNKFSRHQTEKMLEYAEKSSHGKKELGFSSAMADHGHSF